MKTTNRDRFRTHLLQTNLEVQRLISLDNTAGAVSAILVALDAALAIKNENELYRLAKYFEDDIKPEPYTGRHRVVELLAHLCARAVRNDLFDASAVLRTTSRLVSNFEKLTEFSLNADVLGMSHRAQLALKK